MAQVKYLLVKYVLVLFDTTLTPPLLKDNFLLLKYVQLCQICRAVSLLVCLLVCLLVSCVQVWLWVGFGVRAGRVLGPNGT